MHNVDDLKQRILRDPFSVGYHEMALKYDEAYISCQIVDIATKYMPVQYGYGIRKGSPFYQMFYYYIRTLKETGVFHKHSMFYEGQPQQCPDFSRMPISSKSTFTAFLVVLIGMGISIIFLGYGK